MVARKLVDEQKKGLLPLGRVPPGFLVGVGARQVVLRIPIRRIRMFLGLPDRDPLVRGTDPDPNPDPSLFSGKFISKQKHADPDSDPLVRGTDPAPDPDPSLFL